MGLKIVQYYLLDFNNIRIKNDGTREGEIKSAAVYNTNYDKGWERLYPVVSVS